MMTIDCRKYVKRLLLLIMLCLPLKGLPQLPTADEQETKDGQETKATPSIPYYDKRTVSEAVITKLKQDKQMQYRDEDAKKPRSGEGFFRALALLFLFISKIRYILAILLLGFLGFLLYRFMKNNGMNIFRKPKELEVTEEIHEEDLRSASEYEDKIRAAIAARDIRQAVRWWYLYTLFQLANRQLIIPGREKTNNDYLRSMRNTPYYKTFSTLTLDYEYIWYGEFEVSEAQFNIMAQQFRDFNHQLGKAS